MEKAISLSKRLKQHNALGCEYSPGLIPSLNKSKNQKTSGFTIVELLVVIVVIGILAAITIVSYTGITKKANEATVQSDLANASKKLAMYYAQYGEYPQIDPGTGCPTSPNTDTNYCLKFSNGNTSFAYTYKTPTTYGLSATRGAITYAVTESASPALVGTPPAEPTLPESDWITIGTQRWARKNLDVGTRIAGATAQTNNGGTNVVEKYCYGNTDAGCTNTDANGIAYGGLYQWDEAMKYSTAEGAQGICPAGSHVPSDNDWKTLEVQLGMTQATADTTGWRGTNQGTQLKSGGSSGLNMPLAGHRGTGGSFSLLSSGADLWSSSESGGNAWGRLLYTSQADVGRDTSDKAYGFSVRCLGN